MRSKESVLNTAFNNLDHRWDDDGRNLNAVAYVGKTSDEVKRCDPSTFEEWLEYYYSHVRSKSELAGIGFRLYQRVQTYPDGRDITRIRCNQYVYDVTIKRTFQGYRNEIKATEHLSHVLSLPLEETDDYLDRRLDVDRIVRMGAYLVGVQIKPRSFNAARYAPHMAENHREFQRMFGGAVFLVFYDRDEDGWFSGLDLGCIPAIAEECERLRAANQ